MMNDKSLHLLSLFGPGEIYAQRSLAELSGMSLGSVNKLVAVLLAQGYIARDRHKKLSITDLGISTLDKYKVKNAILLAAGFGSRLLPVTLTTAKPVVSVNGQVLVETVIDGLLSSGVENIYIVVGYRKEQFEYLKDKYPNVHLIVNREYIYKNNISSLFHSLEVFEQGNCCVCEADFLIKDPSIFVSHIYSSFYLSRYIHGKTGEWVFKMKGAYISNISLGGADKNTMMGISYWTPDAARMVADKLRDLYDHPSSNNLYWDEVVNLCLKDMKVGIKKVEDSQLIEIDTVLELIELDSSYEKYLRVD